MRLFETKFPVLRNCLTIPTLYRYKAILAKGEEPSRYSSFRKNQNAALMPKELRLIIVSELRVLYSNGCYLDGVVCQGIAIHAMQTRNPNGEYVFPRIATELLSSRQPPSLRWCRNLMFQNYLVSQKPTSARRRDLTPDTVSSQKTDFAARIALLVHLYKIPPHLIFHWDQTGIPVCLIGNRSRASQGVSHVPLYGAHETRLVTGNPFYNMDGIFLAFQVIESLSAIKFCNLCCCWGHFYMFRESLVHSFYPKRITS